MRHYYIGTDKETTSLFNLNPKSCSHSSYSSGCSEVGFVSSLIFGSFAGLGV